MEFGFFFFFLNFLQIEAKSVPQWDWDSLRMAVSLQRELGPRQTSNPKLPGYMACTLATWPKEYTLGQVDRAHDQLERCDRKCFWLGEKLQSHVINFTSGGNYKLYLQTNWNWYNSVSYIIKKKKQQLHRLMSQINIEINRLQRKWPTDHKHYWSHRLAWSNMK